MKDTEFFHNIGLKVGLELHQQLNTTSKLFCHCPPIIRDDPPDGGFIRRLRPTQSEMGEIDPAALFEFKQKKKFYYEYYNDTTCLVEADEEPPHDINKEAIDICLIMAQFLDAKPVDEIHTMRKIVIDGSNTSGFQRTAIIALGGEITINQKKIAIQTICLEEDAARKITDDVKNNQRIYRLDRLGIPLIEIATAPDISTPAEAQEVAFQLGILLRSTGKVKRGLGTIRQDVNVSIDGGGIIEIKGLQQLHLLAKVVELEVQRQLKLLEIRDELHSRGITESSITYEIVNVSRIFTKSNSKVIRKALESGGCILATKLPGFHGLIGKEIQPGRRLGTEFSDYAKFWGGVGGIFHTDELPKYGITQEEVDELRKLLKVQDQDAVVFVAADLEKGRNALEAVIERARDATIGVPAETRIPLKNGTTKYARPRPGAERMYPETDVRPVKIDEKWLKHIGGNMPEPLEQKRKRFIQEYGLSNELATQLVRSLNLDLFETLLQHINISPTIIAVTLENTLISLQRDGIPIENLTENHFLKTFDAVANGIISSEAIPAILSYLSTHPKDSFENALNATGLEKVDEKEIQETIKQEIEQRSDYILAQREHAVSGLMGVIMKKLRGKVSGKDVRQIVENEVKRILSQHHNT